VENLIIYSVNVHLYILIHCISVVINLVLELIGSIEAPLSAVNPAAVDTLITGASIVIPQNTYSKIIAIAAVSVVSAGGSTAQLLTLKLKIGTGIAGNAFSRVITVAAAANTHAATIIAVGKMNEGGSVVVTQGAPAAEATTTITVNNVLVFGVA
jgi:hypothetical protein